MVSSPLGEVFKAEAQLVVMAKQLRIIRNVGKKDLRYLKGALWRGEAVIYLLQECLPLHKITGTGLLSPLIKGEHLTLVHLRPLSKHAPGWQWCPRSPAEPSAASWSLLGPGLWRRPTPASSSACPQWPPQWGQEWSGGENTTAAADTPAVRNASHLKSRRSPRTDLLLVDHVDPRLDVRESVRCGEDGFAFVLLVQLAVGSPVQSEGSTVHEVTQVVVLVKIGDSFL